MKSKKIFLIAILIAICLQSFSQININDSISQGNKNLNTEQINEEIPSENNEELTSENLKRNIFSATIGVDLYTLSSDMFAPRLALSYNYLFPDNLSIGLEYQRWLMRYESVNAIAFDFRKYNMTRKNNLSSLGVDFGLSFIYDEGLFVNKYLMFSPNYMYGIKLNRSMFLALKAKIDLMYNFEWNDFVINPCISIGLVF